MTSIDAITTQLTRLVARFTSRRSALARLGGLLAGSATTLPLLPLLRASAAPSGEATPTDDPQNCEYWRYCALDGFLASCCGGTASSCPPGTEMSTVTWIGTCRNPHDGRDYVISYNDCCGTAACLRCGCDRGEGDRPVYTPAKSNDIMWCLGTKTQSYNSTVARVIATASAPDAGAATP